MTEPAGKIDVSGTFRGLGPLGGTQGRDLAVVAISRVVPAGAVLTILLGMGVEPLFARDEAWTPGGRGPLQEASPGRGGSEGLASHFGSASGLDRHDRWSYGESIGFPDGLSWGYGGPVSGGAGLGADEARRDSGPNAWGPVGPPGLSLPPPAGTKARYGAQAPTWGASSGYPTGRAGFPPEVGGPFTGQGPGSDGYGSSLERGYVTGPPETYSGYRFRGDPPVLGGHWPSAPHEMGYRFRPLTEQERERFGEGPGFRPAYPPGFSDPSRPSDLFLRPEASYGFEPNPWRAR